MRPSRPQVVPASYGEDGLLESISEPGSRTVTLTHTGSDLTSIVDEDGNVRLFSYDDSHRLTRDQWEPYDATFSYDTDYTATLQG